MSTLVLLDLLGIFVFALSGATLAVDKRLDLFGVLMLAGVAAIGGGLLRDVLLGALPPAAIRDGRYLIVPLAAGAIAFVATRHVRRLSAAVRLFDAAGLGLFVATGTTKALALGLGPAGAVAVGTLAGIGGGLLRDVLVGEVPIVLRRELYAVPAVLGGVVVVTGDALDVSSAATAVAGSSVVFVLRMLGLWRDWHAPVAPRPLS
jgi:uncharacterized membrane protein YeiH